MRIEKIEINNFGPFEKLNLNFKSKKVNIIQGNNASGKTNIMAALHFLFYNNDAISIDKHAITNAEVKVDLKIDNFNYVLKKRYINKKVEIVMSDLEKLIDFSSKFNKNNIHFISCETLANKEIITVNEVKKISELIRTLNILESTKKDIVKRIRLDDL